jgi:hypothetical protein
MKVIQNQNCTGNPQYKTAELCSPPEKNQYRLIVSFRLNQNYQQ